MSKLTTKQSINNKPTRMMLSLYIPYVWNHITDVQIARMFYILDLGQVSHIDFVIKNADQKSAYVYFSCWFETQASINLRTKIHSGEPVRLIYSEPAYWMLFQNNHCPLYGPKLEPEQTYPSYQAPSKPFGRRQRIEIDTKELTAVIHRQRETA